MEFDDSSPHVGPSRAERAARTLRGLLSWPRRAPPRVWLAEDLSRKQPWDTVVRRACGAVLLLEAALVVAVAASASREWGAACGTPLGPFLVAAAVCGAVWAVALAVMVQRLTWGWRGAFLGSGAAVLVMAVLGAVWAAEAAKGGCLQTTPALFGVTVAFVVVFGLLDVALLVYFSAQAVAVLVLRRRVVRGWAGTLLTGKRAPRSPFLGVSVVGETGVGKTTLLRVLDAQSSAIFPPGSSSRVVDSNPSRFSVKAGRTTFVEDASTRTTDLVNADCVLLVFAMADRRSFNAAKTVWLPHILQHTAVPIVLVGTVGTRLLKTPIRRHVGKLPVCDALMAPPTPVDEKAVSVAHFPTAVLLRVFDFLPNKDFCACAKTCRLWRDMARHAFSWKTRSAGEVTAREVKAWMGTVRASHVLDRSGFRGFGGFFVVEKEQGGKAVRMWKRVVELVDENESKMIVTRNPSTKRLQISRFTLSNASHPQQEEDDKERQKQQKE